MASLPPVGQQLFDRFCQDIDDNFREMGVGDLAVPKHMQPVGEAFYGRAKVYDERARPTPIRRRLKQRSRATCSARRTAAGRAPAGCLYARGDRRLARQDAAALARAELEFPDPAAVQRLRRTRGDAEATIRNGPRAGSKKADSRRWPQRRWSVPVVVADVPETGRQDRTRAGRDDARGIAAAADAVGLPRLEAAFDLTRHGARRLRVVGPVAATVIQNCVVTLEPIENEVEEAVDLLFPPQARRAEPRSRLRCRLDAADPPETVARRRGRSRRGGDRVPAAGNRSLSAQARRGVRRAGGRRPGRAIRSRRWRP